MTKLKINDLWKLEEYSEQRTRVRAGVIAHKKTRTVALGPNVTLLFEDRTLVQYQVQEMLRIERIFDRAAIQEELDAYNPLIPDGSNWKATCLIEFEDVGERRKALADMKGMEHKLWVRIGRGEQISGIADEDLERSDEEKTSAVHFLRFELAAADIARLKAGAALSIGVEHPHYTHSTEVTDAVRASLLDDLT